MATRELFGFGVLPFILAGIIYLLYLAWGAWRATATKINASADVGLSLAKLYRRGIIMNVTNPKVSIFFLAFLPQFVVDGAGPVSAQLFLHGSLIIIVARTHDTAYFCK